MASSRYFISPHVEMPSENVTASPLHSESLEQCAQLCEQHNATLRQPGYAWDHCNGFVYDAERKMCFLKNKRMGNMVPQEEPFPLGAYNPRQGTARFFSGYRWNALVNEINDAFPNETSGMQFPAGPGSVGGMCSRNAVGGAPIAWSHDDYAVTGNSCTRGQFCQSKTGFKKCVDQESAQCDRDNGCVESQLQQLKAPQYDVRPGAIFSNYNKVECTSRTQPFAVANIQECVDACSRTSSLFGPYTGSNAFTFWPDYTSASMLGASSRNPDNIKNGSVPGMCVVGQVREPYYQTLSPSDNGAISGFSAMSLSREIQRFLFG